MLRPYQQEAHDAAIEWVRNSTAPFLIEAATGAGKSHIIAAIAKTLREISGGKHVLVLQPSADLVKQNRDKYLATGNPASVMSASAGGKSLKHPVVFGTPGTVKNVVQNLGARFAMVIVDEAHGMTPTVRKIISDMQQTNPRLRVVGLTATPYVLGKGYIYQIDHKNRAVVNAVDPYFAKMVYRITAHQLIGMGYLTPPRVGVLDAESYDTSSLVLNSMMKYDDEQVERTFVGQGRKTSAIVADVVEKSRYRKGVMFFAATIAHAHEIMESLPKGLSACVTSHTLQKERNEIVQAFKSQKIKYLVNVSCFTTGFDAPHVDVIAILRLTESAGLYQQIIGRGTRLYEDKRDFLILDYTDNIDRFFPDGDLFNPEIRIPSKSGSPEPITCLCPSCNKENEFSARKNDDGFGIDENGYFLDLMGERVQTDYGYMPAHYGRRCMHSEYSAIHPLGLRCDYRWTSKECGECGEDNDIAARRCHACGAEIVDPNEKLRIDFKQLKKDPTRIQVDEVLSFDESSTISRSGNECSRVEFVTPYRKFTVWLVKGKWNHTLWEQAKGSLKTVTYRKNPDTGFFEVMAYNQEVQACEVS